MIREIAAGLLLLLLLISGAANLWQMGQTHSLTQTLGEVNDSYQRDRLLWEGERAGLQTQVSAQEARLADAQIALAGLEQRLLQTREELQGKTATLQQTEHLLNQSRIEIVRREAELMSQQDRLQNMTEEFTSLQGSLNQSMAWFRDNSKLPITTNWNAKNLADRAQEDCVDGSVVNLACINHILERTATIAYRTDKDNTSRPADHLQSIEETFQTGGGDCEDYSLLLKAVLNTLRERGNYSLMAWEHGGSSKFRVYPKASLGDLEIYWYYADARGRLIGDLASDPVWVVCFPVPSGGGHCTVAVGGQAASAGSGPDLSGARVFEPQDGRYLGMVGREFVVCQPTGGDLCWATPYSIIIVITDNDFYKVQETGWNAYGPLYERIEAEKNAGACLTCGEYT